MRPGLYRVTPSCIGSGRWDAGNDTGGALGLPYEVALALAARHNIPPRFRAEGGCRYPRFELVVSPEMHEMRDVAAAWLRAKRRVLR